MSLWVEVVRGVYAEISLVRWRSGGFLEIYSMEIDIRISRLRFSLRVIAIALFTITLRSSSPSAHGEYL